MIELTVAKIQKCTGKSKPCPYFWERIQWWSKYESTKIHTYWCARPLRYPAGFHCRFANEWYVTHIIYMGLLFPATKVIQTRTWPSVSIRLLLIMIWKSKCGRWVAYVSMNCFDTFLTYCTEIPLVISTKTKTKEISKKSWTFEVGCCQHNLSRKTNTHCQHI